MKKVMFWFAAIAFLIAPTAAQAQGTAFQWDLGGNQGLYTHTPDDTSDFTEVFSFDPASTIAVDFDSADTLIYHDLTGASFGVVDTAAGTATPTMSITGDVPAGSTGITIDSSTDTMWVTDGTALWSVDLATGVGTAGPAITGTPGTVFALAMDSSQNLFGYDIGDDTMYAINTATGVATAVGTSAADGVFSNNGMDFDSSDVLYHALYTGGGTGSYGTWDLGTGVFTEIQAHGTFPIGALGGGMGVNSVDAVAMWNFWGSTVCTWDDRNDPNPTFVSVDQVDSNPPFPLPVSLFAMDFNGDGSVLYGLDQGTAEMGEINPDTGEWTVLFPLSGDAFGTLVDMSYDVTTDTMFVSDVGNLFTLDLTTGALTLVAAYSNTNPLGNAPAIPVGLAVDSTGAMFMFSSGDDALWSVDPVNGECTEVGTLAGTTNNSFIQGMDFDADTDVLYHSAFDADGGNVALPGFYGSWDTATGVFTTIDTIQGIGGTTPSDIYEFNIAIRPAVSGPVDVNADTVNVAVGTLISGGTTELSESDDIDLRAIRNQTSFAARIDVDVTAVSPTENPTAFEFTVESAAFARGSTIQELRFFNYDTGSFELVDNRTRSGNADQIVEVMATGDLSRFVEAGTGNVEARITYRRTQIRSAFAANIDHVFWTITN